MENKTEFDLNGAISNWRTELAAQESIEPAAMRELESHLREGVASWVQKGLSQREAFQIVAGRLGSPENLGSEFQKENPHSLWRIRVFWVLVGVISMHFLSQIAGILIAGGWLLSATMWQATGSDGWNPRINSTSSIVYAILSIALSVASPLAIYYGLKWFLADGSGKLKKFAAFTSSPARMAFSLATLSIGLSLLNSLLQYYHQKILSPGYTGLQIRFLSSALVYQIYPLLLAILIARVAPERLYAKKAKR